MRLTPAHALEALDGHDTPFRDLFMHDSPSVEIYRPAGVDLQQPHSRDELYVVVSGSGWLLNGEAREPFVAGEVLFVSAGVDHRFEDFSDDFLTWVFFYGRKGGEDEAAAEKKP